MASNLGINSSSSAKKPGESEEKNLSSQQKLDKALDKLSIFYNDKSDNDGDGKADHYKPDVVKMIDEGKHKNGKGVKFAANTIPNKNIAARFQRWVDPKNVTPQEYNALKKQGFDENYSKIEVSEKFLKSSSLNNVAAVLAHELNHAEDFNTQDYKTAKNNSVSEEYESELEASKFLLAEGSAKDIESYKKESGIDLTSGKVDKEGLSSFALFYIDNEALPLTSDGHSKAPEGVTQMLSDTSKSLRKKETSTGREPTAKEASLQTQLYKNVLDRYQLSLNAHKYMNNPITANIYMATDQKLANSINNAKQQLDKEQVGKAKPKQADNVYKQQVKTIKAQLMDDMVSIQNQRKQLDTMNISKTQKESIKQTLDAKEKLDSLDLHNITEWLS